MELVCKLHMGLMISNIVPRILNFYLSTIGYWQFAAKLRVRLEQTTHENRVEISSDTGMASIMILRRL